MLIINNGHFRCNSFMFSLKLAKYFNHLRIKSINLNAIYFYNVIASPERAWQSVVASEARQSQPFLTRSPRRFAPRDDTGIIVFVLIKFKSSNKEEI